MGAGFSKWKREHKVLFWVLVILIPFLTLVVLPAIVILVIVIIYSKVVVYTSPKTSYRLEISHNGPQDTYYMRMAINQVFTNIDESIPKQYKHTMIKDKYSKWKRAPVPVRSMYKLFVNINWNYNTTTISKIHGEYICDTRPCMNNILTKYSSYPLSKNVTEITNTIRVGDVHLIRNINNQRFHYGVIYKLSQEEFSLPVIANKEYRYNMDITVTK